ncbi:MAG: hypothetical protein RMJ36_01010 [Candidatus Calescibacterium sp.]|nr:hypothetical protein [Candidatus Calescibacterium sp.]MDW8132220.1 hypothetical protein [Candidatus Calescibacterium sp.]
MFRDVNIGKYIPFLNREVENISSSNSSIQNNDKKIDVDAILRDLYKGKVEMTRDGVKVSGFFGEEEVKIFGDDLEKMPDQSLFEGIIKGLLVGLLGISYPLFLAIAKSIRGYFDGAGAAIGVGLSLKDSIKAGGILALHGAAKALPHGIIDLIGIMAFNAAWHALFGGPVSIGITALVGGFYNLFKDDFRHIYKRIQERKENLDSTGE